MGQEGIVCAKIVGMISRCRVRRALLEWRHAIEDPKYRAGMPTAGDGYQKSDSTRHGDDGAPGGAESLQNAKSSSSLPGSDEDYASTSPRLRDLIDLTFYEDSNIAFRAAWILENLFLKRPKTYLDDLEFLVSQVKDVTYPSASGTMPRS